METPYCIQGGFLGSTSVHLRPRSINTYRRTSWAAYSQTSSVTVIKSHNNLMCRRRGSR